MVDDKLMTYYNSRAWQIIREQIRERSGGTCERCKLAPAQETHHIHYRRKYRELLTDLLDLCTPCHEFLSYVSDFDPRPPVTVVRTKGCHCPVCEAEETGRCYSEEIYVETA